MAKVVDCCQVAKAAHATILR
jgi:hypothetical protein